MSGERVHLDQFPANYCRFRFELSQTGSQARAGPARLAQALFEPGEQGFVSHLSLPILDCRWPFYNTFVISVRSLFPLVAGRGEFLSLETLPSMPVSPALP